MSSIRIHQVEKVLARYRQQIESKEMALAVAPAEDKERIKFQISDLKTEMQPYEKEYWEIALQQSVAIEISEQEAQAVVAEIVTEVSEIEISSHTYPDEVLNLLKEIRNKLNQPDKSAAVKLKGVISSIPPFVGISYEAELDTENFLRTHFPTFSIWIKKAMKKKQLI